jgi:chromate transporter
MCFSRAMAQRKQFPDRSLRSRRISAREPAPHGLAGTIISLVAIFVPGILALIATLPFWETFRKRAKAQAIMRGVNAAVVGLLGATLYIPVWATSVHGPGDLGVALIGFVLLTVWEAPPLVVVVISAVGGIVLAVAPS